MYSQNCHIFILSHATVLAIMILNAGYFHLKHTSLLLDRSPVELAGGKNTAYILSLKEGKTFPKERSADSIKLKNEHNPKARDVLIFPKQGETLDLPTDSIQAIERIEFTPTLTELQTLQYGLAHYSQAHTVFISVDDLGLPPGLAPHLPRFLPEEYKSLLTGRTVVMDSDRMNRNRMTKKIKEAVRRVNPDRFPAEQQHEQTGFVVITADAKTAAGCENGNLAVVSEALGEEKPAEKEPYHAALTRLVNGHSTISCGGIFAGTYETMAAKEDKQVVSIYDVADDPNIGSKTFDGLAILAWLKPHTDVEMTNIILKNGQAKATQWNLSDLSDRGKTSFAEMQHYLAQRAVQFTPLTSGRDVTITSSPSSPACGLGKH